LTETPPALDTVEWHLPIVDGTAMPFQIPRLVEIFTARVAMESLFSVVDSELVLLHMGSPAEILAALNAVEWLLPVVDGSQV